MHTSKKVSAFVRNLGVGLALALPMAASAQSTDIQTEVSSQLTAVKTFAGASLLTAFGIVVAFIIFAVGKKILGKAKG